MISDERLEEIIENNPTFDERVTLAYEIKRLRCELRHMERQCETKTEMLNQALYELSSYPMPNVENATFESGCELCGKIHYGMTCSGEVYEEKG